MVFIQFNDLQVYGISNRNLCQDDQESKSIYYKGQGKSHKITVSDAIQSSQKIIRHLSPLDFCVVSPPLLPFFLSFFLFLPVFLLQFTIRSLSCPLLSFNPSLIVLSLPIALTLNTCTPACLLPNLKSFPQSGLWKYNA